MGRAQNAAFHEPVMKPRQKAAMTGAAGDGDSFGDGLAAGARSIIADARRALADPELSDAEAVHEVRKALKRWRALLRLLARPLGEQADQMRAEARELMRALSGARDAQSALDALHDLRKTDMPLSPKSVETIRRRLTEIRDAAEATSFTKTTRGRLSRYLDYAMLSLERWPLKAIDVDRLERPALEREHCIVEIARQPAARGLGEACRLGRVPDFGQPPADRFHRLRRQRHVGLAQIVQSVERRLGVAGAR